MIIDCIKIADEIIQKSKKNVYLLNEIGVSPKLAIVLVGDDAPSKIYIKNKTKACQKANIKTQEFILPYETSENDLIKLIEKLNTDQSITGILVQLPLPKHINENKICQIISPAKDVDAFSPTVFGNFIFQNSPLIPCTSCAIIEVLKHENIELSGKHCVVIGRSKIVGKPTAALMLNHDATVTICHSKTKNLTSICKNADIIVSATGKPNLIKAEMVKNGAVIIDVGISKDANGNICGDVDFKNVEPLASYITPVPGGIGPVTVAMLVHNTVTAAQIQCNQFQNLKKEVFLK